MARQTPEDYKYITPFVNLPLDEPQPAVWWNHYVVRLPNRAFHCREWITVETLVGKGYYSNSIAEAAEAAGAKPGDHPSTYLTRRLIQNFIARLRGKVARNYRKYGGETKFQSETSHAVLLHFVGDDAPPSTAVAIVPETTEEDDPEIAKFDAIIAEAEAGKAKYLARKTGTALRKSILDAAFDEVKSHPQRGFHTVSEWADKLDFDFTDGEMIAMGKQLTKLSAYHGLMVRETSHPKYNTVNTYAETVLDLYFGNLRKGITDNDLGIE